MTRCTQQKPNTAVFHHARSIFTDLAAEGCVCVEDNYFADGIGASRTGMLPIIYDANALYGEVEMACVQSLSQVTAVLNQRSPF